MFSNCWDDGTRSVIVSKASSSSETNVSVSSETNVSVSINYNYCTSKCKMVSIRNVQM